MLIPIFSRVCQLYQHTASVAVENLESFGSVLPKTFRYRCLLVVMLPWILL